MFGKGHDENCECEGFHGMKDMPEEFKKEVKMAMLRKKEKMLEAKLEFVREINGLIKRYSSAPKENK